MNKSQNKPDRKQFLESLKKQPYHQIIQNKNIYYSFAEKKNQTLTLHNDRYILLFDSQYFGYFNKFQDKISLPFSDLQQVQSCKYQVRLSQIIKFTNHEKVLEIIAKSKETKGIQKKQNKQIKWIFRMTSTDMCIRWFQLIKQAKQPKQKKTKQTNLSKNDFVQGDKSIIRNNSKYYLKEENNNNYNNYNNYNNQIITSKIRNSAPLNQNNEESKQNKVHSIVELNQSKTKSEFFPKNTIENYNNSLKQSKKTQKQSKKSQKFSSPVDSNIKQKEFPFKLNQVTFENQIQNNVLEQNYINVNRSSKVSKKVSKKSEIYSGESPQTILNPKQDQIKNLDQQDKLKNQIINQFSQNWNLELIKNKEQAIVDFKIYCQALVSKVIDEMCLPISKRQYKPNKTTAEYFEYQINGLFLKLCFSNLKQSKNKTKIYDEKTIKKINIEFKNMAYVFQTTKNLGSIRVPLSMIIQYKGIVTLIKSTIKQSQNKTDISQHLHNLSNKTRISNQIYNDQNSIKIAKYNDSISRENYYFFTQMNHYLPQDLMSENNLQSKKLRAEFIQHEMFDNKKFIGIDILSNSRKLNQEISDLQNNEQKLFTIIKQLLHSLENLQDVIINSEQLTQLFHKKGVNIRYLGIVYQNAKIPLVKKICMSQIIARLAKVILRKNLQDEIKKSNEKINANLISDKNLLLNNSDQHLLHLVISFLNSLLRDTPERNLLWQILNKQAEINFNIALNDQQIFEGYFLQALVYHCNLNLLWNKYDSSVQIFKKKEYFSKEMFGTFKSKSKIFDFSFFEPYARISQLIQEQTKQNFNEVVQILQLQTKQIPQYFLHNKLYQKLILFLSAYISPNNQDQFHHLDIYSLTGLSPPSLFSIKLYINQIKWVMKQKNKQAALAMFDNIMIKIKRWCGDYHPLLGQVYQLFSQFYLSRGQSQNAITASKSSLLNSIKTIGNQNIKIAQNYYDLANIYLKCGRKDEALNHYKKSKNIFEINKLTNIVGYALINLKIGNLYLNFGRLSQAIEAILKSLQIFDKQQKYEEQLVQCYQILGRSYQVSNKMNNYKQLSIICSQKLSKIKDPINLQSMIKTTIYPSFFYLSKKNAKKLLVLCNQLPLKFTSQSYIIGYNFIKKFINKFNLIYYIDEKFKTFDQILSQIEQKSSQQKWRSIQQQQNIEDPSFVGLLQSLMYFLGQTFILGSLSR